MTHRFILAMGCALLLSCAGAALASEPPRTKAEALLSELDGPAPDQRAAASTAARARKALERADEAARIGDVAAAQQFEAIALEWAQAAADIRTAAQMEEKAAAEAHAAEELIKSVEKARLLLTETQARLGQIRAELERAWSRVKDDEAAALEPEAERVDAAKPKAVGGTP